MQKADQHQWRAIFIKSFAPRVWLTGYGQSTVLALILLWVNGLPILAAYLPVTLRQEAEVLSSNQSVEKSLAGEQVHRYQVNLTAGQYLQLTVEQKGINVVVVIVPPGKNAIEYDYFEAQPDREEVFFMAEQNGFVQIEIKASLPKAPVGNYVLSLETIRTATEQDRRKARAQELFCQSEALNAKGKKEDIPAIIKSYEEAIALFRQTDQIRWVVKSLKGVGAIAYRIGDYQKAAAYFSEALPLARTLPEPPALSGILNDLGLTRSRLGDLAKAQECYEEALRIHRSTKNKTGEAITLNNLGGVLINRGELEKGLALQEQSLALRRELGDEGSIARILSNLAGTYWALGQVQRSLELGLQALPLRRKFGDKPGEANTLTTLALAYGSSGEVQKSLEFHELALRVWRDVGNRAGEANALQNIGLALRALGDWQKSLRYLQQSLALWEAAGVKTGQADTLDAISDFYRIIGDLPRTLEFLQQARDLRRQVGDKTREGASWNNIGLHYQEAGESAKALEHFQQALPLFQATKYKSGESSTLNSIGLALEKLGKQTEAQEYYEQALALAQTIDDRDKQAAAQINLGNLKARLGNDQQAMQHLTAALLLSRSIGHKEYEIKSLFHLAETDWKAGRLLEAEKHAQSTLGLIETNRLNLAHPSFRAGYLSTQKKAYELETALLMQLQQREPTTSYAAQALHTVERAKARSLLESLREASTDIRQGVAPALLEQEKAIRLKLDRRATEQTALLSGKHTPAQSNQFAKEIADLSTAYEQIQNEIRAQSPRYATITQPQPLNLSQIQKEVVTDANTILLEYAQGEDKSWLWAVTSAGMQSYELPKRAEIEAAARRVYELLTARNQRSKFEEDTERRLRIQKADAEFPQAAAVLSQMILAPVAAELGNKRLLIVADGALQYVPFGALPEPVVGNKRNQPPATSHQPLIANHEIVSLPSASTLAVLRRELAGRKPAPKSIAVIADPVFEKNDARLTNAIAQNPSSDKVATRGEWWQSELERSARDVSVEGERAGFARLPATRAEAQAVVKFAPANSSLTALDFAANQATATSEELSQYRYVHFATHGVLNNEHPELSGLVLSLLDERGNDIDGFLRLVEIYNLKLPAEMVTLSACRTGLGKEVKGEGLISLTRGFMYAGAARVLVSLWDVNDASTAALMSRVYQSVLQEKLSPTAALRKAQNAMRQDKRWSAPFYWASFTLHGEPR